MALRRVTTTPQPNHTTECGSEQRQSSELAQKILQVSRDTEVARRADFDRLLATYRLQQGTSFDASPRQQGALESLRRVSLQR